MVVLKVLSFLRLLLVVPISLRSLFALVVSLFPLFAHGEAPCSESENKSSLVTIFNSNAKTLVSSGYFDTLESLRENVLQGMGRRYRRLLSTSRVSIYEVTKCQSKREPIVAFGRKIGFIEPSPSIQATEVDDQYFKNQWALDSKEGYHIDAIKGWKLETGSPEVIIAHIDTGVDYNSPELSHKMWRNDLEVPENGLDDDSNGYIDDVYGIDSFNHTSNPYDDNGHGSHTAGIAAAQGNNGFGIAGVSHHAKIMSLKALDKDAKGDHVHAIECLAYILSMKDRDPSLAIVSSNSWGDSDYSVALEEAVREMGNAGILFVAAAGNSRKNADFPSDRIYPGALDLPNVISVAAHTKQGKRAGFSTFGVARVHISAPGADIFSLWKDGQFEHYSGTSMSTPHVAGIAALLLSQDRTLNPANLRSILLESARFLPSMATRVSTDGAASAYGALAFLRGEVLVSQDPDFEKEILEGEVVTAISRFKNNTADVKWYLLSPTGIMEIDGAMSGGEVLKFNASLDLSGNSLITIAAGINESRSVSRRTPIMVRSLSLGARKPTIPSAVVLFNSAVKTGEYLRASVPRSQVDGTGPFKYRWYFRGVIVPDETGDSIKLGPMTLADSGSSFKVDVIGPTGLTASSSAVLTVYE